MQMMAFGAVAPLKNPMPFSNTPRNDNHEEVFRIFGFILRMFAFWSFFIFFDDFLFAEATYPEARNPTNSQSDL